MHYPHHGSYIKLGEPSDCVTETSWV